MQSEDIAGLIHRVALGDRAAFARLYETTSAKLFSICLRILRDRAEAEDVLQDVYIKIWQRSKSFATGAGQPTVWLSAIARNQAIDVIRARKPVSDDLDAAYDLADESIADPERQVTLVDEGRRIDDCMNGLEASHARAVRQAYVDGLSYLELSEQLQVPLNTVRTWLRRSLLKLRKCLDP